MKLLLVGETGQQITKETYNNKGSDKCYEEK